MKINIISGAIPLIELVAESSDEQREIASLASNPTLKRTVLWFPREETIKSVRIETQSIKEDLDGRRTLNQLNTAVTDAIIEFEKAAANVSRLEEEISTHTPPDSPEGRIARRGAITMALHSRNEVRADMLRGKFCAEQGADPQFLSELRSMLRPNCLH